MQMSAWVQEAGRGGRLAWQCEEAHVMFFLNSCFPAAQFISRSCCCCWWFYACLFDTDRPEQNLQASLCSPHHHAVAVLSSIFACFLVCCFLRSLCGLLQERKRGSNAASDRCSGVIQTSLWVIWYRLPPGCRNTTIAFSLQEEATDSEGVGGKKNSQEKPEDRAASRDQSPGSHPKARGAMSSTKFKKDKEIIADYETQVKGGFGIWSYIYIFKLFFPLQTSSAQSGDQ